MRDPFDPMSISAKPKDEDDRRSRNLKAARLVDSMQGKNKKRQSHPWIVAAKKGKEKKNDP